MRFANPAVLFLLFLIPVLAVGVAYLRARREKALVRLSSHPPKTPFAGTQTALMLVGLALCLLAAARPQWGVETVRQVRLSRNVVVAIDVSRSMRARDVRPDRLSRAKSDIADLVEALVAEDDDGQLVRDRCALVAFRNDAQLICPLTDDQAYLKEMLATVNEDSAMAGETSLGAGIERSLAVLHEDVGPDGEKADHSAVILISDGGDLANWARSSAEKARARGIPVFTVGIGDPEKGATIPLADGGVVQETVRDASGKAERKDVVVKLEDEAMKEIARLSGGRYIRIGTAQTAETTLGDIYRDFLRQVAVREQNEAGEHLGERYQWFLVPGLALLLAGAALSRGRYRLNMERR